MNIWTDAAVTHHSDADGVIELVHEDADDRRRHQEQDERVLELETHTHILTHARGRFERVCSIRDLIKHVVGIPGQIWDQGSGRSCLHESRSIKGRG